LDSVIRGDGSTHGDGSSSSTAGKEHVVVVAAGGGGVGSPLPRSARAQRIAKRATHLYSFWPQR
jgi:hypothetical protein